MKFASVMGIAAVTFMATLLTACISRPVFSEDQMRAHRTGYPFTFIEQNLKPRYDPATFPQYFSFVSPRDTSFKLDVWPFIASWGMIFGVVFGVVWALSRPRKRHAF